MRPVQKVRHISRVYIPAVYRHFLFYPSRLRNNACPYDLLCSGWIFGHPEYWRLRWTRIIRCANNNKTKGRVTWKIRFQFQWKSRNCTLTSAPLRWGRTVRFTARFLGLWSIWRKWLTHILTTASLLRTISILILRRFHSNWLSRELQERRARNRKNRQDRILLSCEAKERSDCITYSLLKYSPSRGKYKRDWYTEWIFGHSENRICFSSQEQGDWNDN